MFTCEMYPESHHRVAESFSREHRTGKDRHTPQIPRPQAYLLGSKNVRSLPKIQAPNAFEALEISRLKDVRVELPSSGSTTSWNVSDHSELAQVILKLPKSRSIGSVDRASALSPNSDRFVSAQPSIGLPLLHPWPTLNAPSACLTHPPGEQPNEGAS